MALDQWLEKRDRQKVFQVCYISPGKVHISKNGDDKPLCRKGRPRLLIKLRTRYGREDALLKTTCLECTERLKIGKGE